VPSLNKLILKKNQSYINEANMLVTANITSAAELIFVNFSRSLHAKITAKTADIYWLTATLTRHSVLAETTVPCTSILLLAILFPPIN